MPAASPRVTKILDLALHGGGAHGALTWGALERLLDDERSGIASINGTSAGAINAVVMADGLERAGCGSTGAAFSRSSSPPPMSAPGGRSQG